MLGSAFFVAALLAQAPSTPDPSALVAAFGSAGGEAGREAARSLEGLGSRALPALRASMKGEIRNPGSGRGP